MINLFDARRTEREVKMEKRVRKNSLTGRSSSLTVNPFQIIKLDFVAGNPQVLKVILLKLFLSNV